VRTVGPQPPFSLVIPAFNQRQQALESVHVAREHLDDVFGTRAELIVVDDGSKPDESLFSRDLPERTKLVKHVRNEGKGSAVRSGILEAQGEYVVFTDSDLPFTLEPLETTVTWLADGADVVIGDRLLPESECITDVTAMRRLSSVVFTFMVTRVVGLPFRDTQCGYKGYRRRPAHQLYARLNTLSFAFDVEILARALSLGYSIRRQPLRLTNNDASTVRLSRHAPRMLFDMTRIAWHTRFDRYV
jgi:glycosyltransferase involved in cell wall biosynthesis